jgi:Protein kinase domain
MQPQHPQPVRVACCTLADVNRALEGALYAVEDNRSICAGSVARLTYSLAYSAPETLRALNEGAQMVVAQTALDMWAVGVIAYELMIGHAAFPQGEWMKWDIHAAAVGKRAYPWESDIGTFRNIPELRALKPAIFKCLARDAVDRPSSAGFLALLNGLFDHHGTGTVSTSSSTRRS